MSFLIDYDEKTQLGFNINSKTAVWDEQLNAVGNILQMFINMDNFKGKAADNVKSYLSEVHLSIIISLNQIMEELGSRYLLYKDGYYSQIDSDPHAKLCENTLDELLQFFNGSRYEFDDAHSRLQGISNSINDIMWADVPSSYSVSDSYETVLRDQYKLKEDITAYEDDHSSKDFINLDNMIDALSRLIDEYIAKDNNSIGMYESAALLNSANFQALATSIQNAAVQRSAMSEALQAAGAREQERFKVLESEWADERQKKGWLDGITGALIVIGGGACIVLTAGLATPLVVAGCVAGGATIAYGCSNVGEAGQDIYYGSVGDYSTAAWNPLRDTLFGGNQEAYDIFGTACVLSTTVFTLGAGGMSVASAATKAGTSAFRALGVYSAKVGVSVASGVGGGKLGHWSAKELGADDTTADIVGVLSGVVLGAVTGGVANKIDKAYNLSGYHADVRSVPKQEIDASKSQKKVIESVENGSVKLENNLQKGNYGEMKMDQFFEGKGFDRISHDRVTDINSPTHKGIDGVYYSKGPPPTYAIGEAKYGSSMLKMTNDGMQMSDSWIRGSDRLINAVGTEIYDEIISVGYTKYVASISSNGNVNTTIIP